MVELKELLLRKALKFFNAFGIEQTEMQQIADAANISMKELTDIFARKDDVVEALYIKLNKELRGDVSTLSQKPDFNGMVTLVRKFYHFQKKYKFFFLYTYQLEMGYPALGKDHRQHIEERIIIGGKILWYNANEGRLRDDVPEGTYESVGMLIWIVMSMWEYQVAVRGIENDKPADMQHSFWHLIKPYFTEKGWEAYRELGLERHISTESLS